jgi:hypothetical protein
MPTTPVGQRMGRLFNSLVAAVTRMGISVYGSRVLYVRGRKSGEWRSTPVNPLSLDGKRYWSRRAPGYPVFEATRSE